MLNRKYFPFERNSYYFGKLLSAKDFETEQKYLNDKRRFVNRVTGANGIVSGMGVIAADDMSVIIQAGCAFDASGREIIIPETKVIKLSTIEGFSQLSTTTALLGIRYDEQPADEVYSAMAEGANVQHNKVKEQFKLSLLDENLSTRIPDELDEYITRKVIYSDTDVRVVQITPTYVLKGRGVAVEVRLERVSPGSAEYSMMYQLEAPGFVTDRGSNTLDVAVNGLKLVYGEAVTLEYTIIPEDYVFGGSCNAVVKNFLLKKNDESYTIKQNITIPLKPSPMKLPELYFKTYYSRSMDKVLTSRYDEQLWIARINLIRQENVIMIDSVAPPPFVQYCYNAQQLYHLGRLEQYMPTVGSAAAAISAEQPQGQSGTLEVEAVKEQKQVASGVFDFPLGLGYSVKTPMFSEEIMHGLGKGPVHVDVGIEYISKNEKGETSGELILGDTSLFGTGSDDEHIYNVSLAVKVLLQRGTFIVALKAGEASNIISIRIRWFATRIQDAVAAAQFQGGEKRMIMANPDTVIVQPKGTAHITPVFINMPTEVCTYRVLDPEGGNVDNNGLYTAPVKEGVYEIRIEAISDPTVYTHVFAIVSQKKKENKVTE